MMRKLVSLIFITAIFATLSSWPSRAQPAQPGEYMIKAAFLYNFAKFVDWPAKAFPNGHAPINVCIFGKDPFGDAFEPIKGKIVKGRKLSLRQVKRLEELEQCHILFISSSEDKRLSQILSAIRGKNILTVSDIKMFARRGGIINFVIVERKIRFEINVEAARLAGLEISSKLLKLAKIVRDEGQKENN